jgi:hypothetical protein
MGQVLVNIRKNGIALKNIRLKMYNNLEEQWRI